MGHRFAQFFYVWYLVYHGFVTVYYNIYKFTTRKQCGHTFSRHLTPLTPQLPERQKRKKAKASVLQRRIDTRRLTYALTVKSEDGEESTCYYTSFTHLQSCFLVVSRQRLIFALLLVHRKSPSHIVY